MKRVLRRKPSPSMVVAIVALVTAAVGIAYASIPDSSGVIHGCYANSGPMRFRGALRVIDTEKGESCTSRETPLDWNQQGPPGPPGSGVPTRFAEVSNEECTSSTTFTDLATVGPSIQVDVPANALALVEPAADIKSDGFGVIGLFEPTDIDPPDDFGGEGPTGDQFVGPHGGGSWTVYHLTPGTRTLKMVYRLDPNTGTSACFRNRKLWVTLFPVSGS